MLLDGFWDMNNDAYRVRLLPYPCQVTCLLMNVFIFSKIMMNVPKQITPFVTQTLSVRTPSAHLNVNVMMGSLDLAIFVFKVSISHAHL